MELDSLHSDKKSFQAVIGDMCCQAVCLVLGFMLLFF